MYKNSQQYRGVPKTGPVSLRQVELGIVSSLAVEGRFGYGSIPFQSTALPQQDPGPGEPHLQSPLCSQTAIDDGLPKLHRFS